MGISLNGLTPAGTYPGLIKTGDNTAIDGTLKVLSDGNGNNLPMEVSTTGVNFTNQLQQGGVAVPTASQVAAKQDTLVSGTNIKTINGVTVLGSGDIVTPFTPPSGVSGAIQFSTGSAFGSDASNLFWDDTNKRLGVGTNAPSATTHIKGVGSTSATTALLIQNSSNLPSLAITNDNVIKTANLVIIGGASETTGRLGFFNDNVRIARTSGSGLEFRTGSASLAMTIDNSQNVGIGIDTPTARTHIKGSGSTSATTSLLVQNSAASTSLQLTDDGRLNLPLTGASNRSIIVGGSYIGFRGDSNKLIGIEADGFVYYDGSNRFKVDTSGNVTVYGELNMNSTTKGFLPPRMTTTQKNAIASPAAGLVVYDSTTNKLQCYNGSTWNDLF
jgi:hypothetical protein